MNIDIRQTSGVTVLDIDGRIIGAESLALKNIIDGEIDSAEDGEVKMLLNMKHVRAMDSSVLELSLPRTRRATQGWTHRLAEC